MARDFRFRKRFIVGTLGIFILADLGLGAYSWQSTRQQTSPLKRLESEKNQYKWLKADVERAEQIRDGIPAVQADCDRFEKSLPLASAGYSAIEGGIGELARKAGLRVDTLGFKEKPVADHPLVEVQIEAAVSGNYASLAHFVNNLQKSPGLFIVDEMTLTAQNQPVAAGHLRVNLHLRTFFRTA